MPATAAYALSRPRRPSRHPVPLSRNLVPFSVPRGSWSRRRRRCQACPAFCPALSTNAVPLLSRLSTNLVPNLSRSDTPQTIHRHRDGHKASIGCLCPARLSGRPLMIASQHAAPRRVLILPASPLPPKRRTQ